MKNSLYKTALLYCAGVGLICFFPCVAAHAHGIPEEDIRALMEGGNPEYILYGAKHMVTGYDHLLFLFGVMFFLKRFTEIIKFVTAFTLGHSITLLFGTLMSIKANYYLVDAVIALTVCYKGLENIGGLRRYLHIEPFNLVGAVFVFGLVHGFGLSTRLQELPLQQDDLILNILSFNLGVELGQIAALTVILAILLVWRQTASFNRLAVLANKILIVLGVLLFLMQLHGYIHLANPDDFGFSEDLHNHAHEELDAASEREHRHMSIDQ